MGKNRKQPKYQNEVPRRGSLMEARMDARHHGYSLMDRFPRDGPSSGHPPHTLTGPPPYRLSHDSSMQSPTFMQHPADLPSGHASGFSPYSSPEMRMMPANVPHSYFQQRGDPRGLRHRLFNEGYRYAGPQQVYAPPDINNQFAEPPVQVRVPPSGLRQNKESWGKSQLRGDAPVFVPKDKSDDESAVYSFDQFTSSDSGIKVGELDLTSDQSRRNSTERVAWLVVSSTR